MKKLLSKLALFITGAAMAIGAGIVAFADEYKEVRAENYVSTYSATTTAPANNDVLAASTSDPAEATYTWTTDATGVFANYSEETRGIQTGSNSATCSYQRFTSSSFSGYVITSVVVKAKSNGEHPAVSVSIGGHSFDSQDLTANYANYTFNNLTTNYSGELIVSLTKDAGTKYLMCASVTVNYTNVAKNITSLAASLNDNQKVFYANESIATSDIKVVVTYDDSSTDTVTDGTGLTITSGNPLVEGENTIGLSFTNVYGTDTTSLVVTARPERVLDHYSIAGDLTKKSYFDGDDWDLSGLVLKAHYTSGLDELDPVEIGSVVDLHTAGDLTYTLSPTTALFGTRKLNITAIKYLTTDVASIKISGIQVQEQPKFIKYTAATLEDGNYALVYDGKAMNNVDAYPSNKNRRLEAVDVSSSISDNKLIAPTEDIIFKITEVDDVNHYYTIQDADDKYVIHSGKGNDNYIAMNATLGDTAKWTVEFDNVNKTYDFVNVGYNAYKIRLNSSYFATNKGTTGDKLTLYKEPVPYVSVSAETYDLGIGDEITVTATPINGATGVAVITVDDDSLINFVDNGNNTATVSVKNGILTSGEVVVTATLNESSASILLNISNTVSLRSIEIKTNPKLNYIVGETIDLSGLEVEATFSDEHKEDVTSEVTLTDTSGINTSIKGTYEITVSYTYLELTRTAKFTIKFSYQVVNVTEAIAAIEADPNKAPDTTYEVRGVVCKTNDGVYIADKYNEQDKTKMLYLWGLSNDVANQLVIGSTISLEAKLKYYDSKSVYETINSTLVVLDFDDDPEVLVSGISIYREPTVTQYYVGDTTFNYDGLKVKLHYNDESSQTYVYSDDKDAFLLLFEITDPDTSDSKAYVPVKVTHKATGFSTSFDVSVADVKVSSIEVTTNPTKTAYASGEAFDPTGIVVTAKNNNGTTFVVEDTQKLTYVTPSGDGKLHDGDTKVKVVYDNNNNIYTYVNVTVADRYVTGIRAEWSSHGYHKDIYDIGETLDTDSLLIYIIYSDGDEVKYNSKNAQYTTLFTITSPDMSTYGEKDVSIALKNTTHTTTVKILVRGIEALSIDTKPNRLVYRVGDSLDFDGIVLTALYSDSTTQDVKMNWDGVTVTGDTSKDGAQQTITISYKGQSDSFKIDVWMTDEGMATLIETEIAKLRTAYVQNDYSDENWTKVQKIINDTEGVLDEFDPKNEGEHYSSDVMEWINYAKEEISKIAVRSLSKITVSGPTKTTYETGDSLDLTGLVVTAHFDDQSTKVLESSQYSLSEVDMSTAGEKTITVTYGNKTATFVITVNDPVQPEKTVTGIAVKTNPTTTTYDINGTINLEGLVITVTYSDSTTEDITTGFTTNASEIDMSSAGTKTVTVTYEGQTATFTITVNESVDPQPTKTLESITVSGPSKTSYNYGEDLDTADLVVTAHYSDQSSDTVTGWTVSGYDKNTAGQQTITVTYTEGDVTKTATFTVTVAKKPVDPVDPAVEEARSNAIAEYKDYFDSIDLSGYSEEVIAQFNALKEEALAALGDAATEEEIAAALANARNALNNLVAQNPKVEPATNNANLGLILGLSIGGGLLVAGGVIALVLILKKKKKVA